MALHGRDSNRSLVCIDCGEEKPLDEFCRDNRQENGRANKCKICYQIARALDIPHVIKRSKDHLFMLASGNQLSHADVAFASRQRQESPEFQAAEILMKAAAQLQDVADEVGIRKVQELPGTMITAAWRCIEEMESKRRSK